MIKKCVVCGKKFECYDKPKYGGRKGGSKRRSDSVTCSKKCAMINGHRKRL